MENGEESKYWEEKSSHLLPSLACPGNQAGNKADHDGSGWTHHLVPWPRPLQLLRGLHLLLLVIHVVVVVVVVGHVLIPLKAPCHLPPGQRPPPSSPSCLSGGRMISNPNCRIWKLNIWNQEKYLGFPVDFFLISCFFSEVLLEKHSSSVSKNSFKRIWDCSAAHTESWGRWLSLESLRYIRESRCGTFSLFWLCFTAL